MKVYNNNFTDTSLEALMTMFEVEVFWFVTACIVVGGSTNI